MSVPKFQPVTILLLAVVMALSVLIPWYVTRAGEGVDVDSIFYLCQARTVVKDGVLEIPNGLGGLTARNYWSPLYPLTLAALSHFGADALVVSRWLNMLLYPLGVLLVALLAARVSRSWWCGLLAAFLFATAPCIMQSHVVAMSDSLALAFTLLSLWLLVLYYDYGKFLLLGLAALAAGGALLTRYDAVTQIPVAFLFLAIYGPGLVRRRLAAAVGFVLIAGLPLMLYQFSHPQSSTMVGSPDVAINRDLAQAMVNDRKFKFYGLTHQHGLSAVRSYEDWLAPIGEVPFAKRAIIMALLALGLLAALAGSLRPPPPATPWRPDGLVLLMLANLLAHEAILYINTIFLDPSFNLVARYHIPTFSFLIIIVVAILAAWYRALPEASRRFNSRAVVVASMLLTLFFCTYAIGAVRWVRQADEGALGLASPSWRDPQTLTLLRQLSTTGPIYSNQVKAIYLYTGRTDFYVMPFRADLETGVPTPTFDQNMAAMTAALTASKGSLVFFTADQPSLHRFASLDELKNNPALRISAQTNEATFFVAAAPPSAGAGH